MQKLVFIFLVVTAGCFPTTDSEERSSERAGSIKYAKSFHFESVNEKEYLVIDQPWPNATTPIKYDLSTLPETFVCTSTSHLPFFELLQSEDQVIGFPNIRYISSKVFTERAEKGFITDLGPDDHMNMELLMGINPDAVIAFDMSGESNALDKIVEAGIPVYYNSDFLEETPLGRAEWIKFFGALLDKREMADSIFNKIENDYVFLRDKLSTIQERPTILSGVVYGDTWFLPGGNNWAATFYKDAGGDYLWKADTTSGWLELSFESVYEKGVNAEFWIGTSTINTKEELLGQDERYSAFEPFVEDNVFNYNKIIGPNGGYDFFESGYARPDLVLSDLIKILHPEFLPAYEMVYFQKLP